MIYPLVFCGSNIHVLEYLAKRPDVRILYCFFHKKSLNPEGFLSLCRTYNLRHAVVKNNRQIENILKKIPIPVLGVSSGFEIISEKIFRRPKLGFINIHPSYLPYYKGANPFYHMLLNNEKEGGVSIHRISRQADCGKIIARTKYRINFEDDIAILIKKAELGAVKLLDKYLARILKGPVREIINPPGNYYPPVKKRQSIDLTDDPLRIYNLVRSQTVYGGCLFYHKRKRLSVIKADFVPPKCREVVLKPNQLCVKVNKNKRMIFTFKGEASWNT